MYDPVIHLYTVIEESIYETFSIEYVHPSTNPGAFTILTTTGVEQQLKNRHIVRTFHISALF